MRNAIVLLTLALLCLGGCRRRAHHTTAAQPQTDLTLCPSGARCPQGTQCSRDAQGEVCLPVTQQQTSQPQVVQCRKHHECMQGQRCGKWASGMRACMGGGLVGAPCRKHSQCVHGLRCERRPTDNLPVCTDGAGNYAPAPPANAYGQQPQNQPPAQNYAQGQGGAAPNQPQPYPQAQTYPPPAAQGGAAGSGSAARRSDWDTATQGYLYCNSGVDCGSGTFCRDRGDGVSMCMGGGVTGAPCAVGTDCSSGLFCKDRGDGLKLCMGKGARNAPCASGVDCNPGLMCKDRGDGLQLCM